MAYRVTGWDPYYSPGTPLGPTDVVLLTYVLNVIEEPTERRRTLARVWDLTTKVLVVSARLTWESAKVRGGAFGDGVLTGRSTFQHLFRPGELRRYVEELTGTRCVSAAPGVVYAFRDDSTRLRFLARRIIPDEEWLASADTTSALAAVVNQFERRGRIPRIAEMPEPIAELLSPLRYTDLKRLAHTSADPKKVADGAKRTVLQTLLFLAVELFNGRGPFGRLPLGVQLDVRAFFSSYKEACWRADRLLLKLRDDQYVRGAMNASLVGKLTPTALYVHRRAAESLPTVLRLYEHCASIVAGRPSRWTLVKLAHHGRAVSWLDYPEFDKDPHPRILSSYNVDLKTFEASNTSYAKSTNRPLLHRKHEFLGHDDPDFTRYERLTASEVRAGLYENPRLIGREEGWEAELVRCGRELQGHRLVRRIGA